MSTHEEDWVDTNKFDVTLATGRRFSRRTMTKMLGGALATPAIASLIAACGSSNAPAASTASSGSSGGSNATVISGIATPMNTFQNSAGSPTAASKSATPAG